MSLKPTLRNNGLYMVTVNVRFDLSLTDVVAIAVSRFWDGEVSNNGGTQKNITKTALDEEIRSYLFMDGCDRIQYEEEKAGMDADEAFAWATEQVTSLYSMFEV